MTLTEEVLKYLQEHGSATVTELRFATGFSHISQKYGHVLKELRRQGLVTYETKYGSSKYGKWTLTQPNQIITPNP